MAKRKNPALPPTVDEAEKEDMTKDYLSETDRKHLQFIRGRMENARDVRNAPRDEFDGMGYLEAYDRDTKAALAYVSNVKNVGESRLSTGTTRQSLMSLISRATSYNYRTEFSPFDKSNAMLRELGQALEISVEQANYLDGDDEQVKEGGNELFTHGDVIKFEDWVVRWGTEKTRPAFDGKVKGVTWTERKKKLFEGCERRTVQGRRFYFGDIFTSSIDRQPHCFEVNYISYADARQKYGDWERFVYVKPKGKDGTMDDESAFCEDWSLENTETEDLEEIIYVDVPNNEMQVILGGVPMLPIGYPMKWAHGKYPWAHQGAEPIRTGFIYHRSFVRTLLNMQDIENDLWRVLIMLAWKAAIPPMANNTGRVLSRRNLMAGEINEGINADQIKPIIDGSLANTGFIDNVLARINSNMTSRSVPEIKQGLTQQGLNTATETIQVQKEAEIALSMNLSALAGIQMKADRLRAYNIMQYAYAKGDSFSVERPNEGGIARYVIEAVESPSDGKSLMRREDEMSKKEGGEVRIINVRKDALDMVDRLEARTSSKPRQSSAVERMELTAMFQAASAIFGQRLNPEFLESMFRSAYRVPKGMRLTVDMPQELEQQSPQARPQPLPTGAGLGNLTPNA